MNYKGTKIYVDKVNKIRNKADMIQGCINRMCITDSREELLKLYAYFTLYATELYRLNCDRLLIAEYGIDKS